MEVNSIEVPSIVFLDKRYNSISGLIIPNKIPATISYLVSLAPRDFLSSSPENKYSTSLIVLFIIFTDSPRPFLGYKCLHIGLDYVALSPNQVEAAWGHNWAR